MNNKIIKISLSSMFGDFENVFSIILSEKNKKLIILPIISFSLLFAQIMSENYLPWWSGFIIGLIWGFIFGWIGVWIYTKILYGLCWVFRHDLKHDIFTNITYSSFGALLYFSLTGLIFLIGSLYLKVSWFSGNAFLILGILWSGFSFARLLNAQRRSYFSSILLSFIFLISILLIMAYLLPSSNHILNSIIQKIGFLKNNILVIG